MRGSVACSPSPAGVISKRDPEGRNPPATAFPSVWVVTMNTQTFFSWLLVGQSLLALILAPSDGGSWLLNTFACCLLLDLVYILVVGLKAGQQIGKWSMRAFILASICTGFAGAFLARALR